MYEVIIERQAQKQLARIPGYAYRKITNALKALAQNPRPHGYKKLKGRNGYRIRFGDYRIIYTISDNILTVYVINIDKRDDVYG
jgi:mRNA interferase RelE/StbE